MQLCFQKFMITLNNEKKYQYEDVQQSTSYVHTDKEEEKEEEEMKKKEVF